MTDVKLVYFSGKVKICSLTCPVDKTKSANFKLRLSIKVGKIITAKGQLAKGSRLKLGWGHKLIRAFGVEGVPVTSEVVR